MVTAAGTALPVIVTLLDPTLVFGCAVCVLKLNGSGVEFFALTGEPLVFRLRVSKVAGRLFPGFWST